MIATKLKLWASRNIDGRTVVSAAVGTGLLGLVAFAASKTNIGAVKKAGNIAVSGKAGG